MRCSDLTVSLAGLSISVRAETSKNALRRKNLRFQPSRPGEIDAFFTEKYHSLPNIDTGGFSLKANNRYWSFYENHHFKVFTIKPSHGHDRIVAVLNSSMDEGDIYLRRKEDDWLNSRLRMIVLTRLLARKRAFIFHACGVRDGSEGYLFLGRSGSGKSTLSRLWHKKNAQVIHDDQVIVRQGKGGFYMSTSEIFGQSRPTVYSDVRNVTLRKIFFLAHGIKNKIIPKDRREGLAAMFDQASCFAWDRGELKNMFHFYLDLVDNIKSYDLEFLPDETCVDFVRGFHKKGLSE